MWRKIAYVILVISMIGEVIITLVLMINFGIWIGFSFLICALVISTFFGMTIELCDNVAESRESLAHIAYLLKSGYPMPSDTALSRLTGSSNTEKGAEKIWICSECGGRNNNSELCCNTCGKYK